MQYYARGELREECSVCYGKGRNMPYIYTDVNEPGVLCQFCYGNGFRVLKTRIELRKEKDAEEAAKRSADRQRAVDKKAAGARADAEKRANASTLPIKNEKSEATGATNAKAVWSTKMACVGAIIAGIAAHLRFHADPDYWTLVVWATFIGYIIVGRYYHFLSFAGVLVAVGFAIGGR